jgi:serpin B
MNRVGYWMGRLFRHPPPPDLDLESEVITLPERSLSQLEGTDFLIRRHADSESLEHTAPMAEGEMAFALDFYKHACPDTGNVLFSPMSLRDTLAMAAVGARGETATQMHCVLHLDPSEHSTGGGVPNRALESSLVVANSLWTQVGEPLQAKYLADVAERWGGTVTPIDFRADPDGAGSAINQWVKKCTQGRIADFLAADAVTADARLLLVNAVHFKAAWQQPFLKASTHSAPFTLMGGNQVEVPLMRQRTSVAYLTGPDYQAIDLSFDRGHIAMRVILPHVFDGLANVERKLTASALSLPLEGGQVRAVDILLPRFNVSWGPIDVASSLARLGMPLPFTRIGADFSGINGLEPPHEEALFISNVWHRAFARIDEAGAEATAATVASMMLCTGLRQAPEPVPLFRADHPFLFVIYEQATRGILFLGRFADPGSEQRPGHP